MIIYILPRKKHLVFFAEQYPRNSILLMIYQHPRKYLYVVRLKGHSSVTTFSHSKNKTDHHRYELYNQKQKFNFTKEMLAEKKILSYLHILQEKIVKCSIGNRTDARFDSPMASDARFEFSHRTVIPISFPLRQEQGWRNIRFLGQGYLGPGSTYSLAIQVSNTSTQKHVEKILENNLQRDYRTSIVRLHMV